MIVKFFSEPDAQRTNPRYRSAAPVKLYSIEKVNAVIQTEEYKIAQIYPELREECEEQKLNTKTSEFFKSLQDI